MSRLIGLAAVASLSLAAACGETTTNPLEQLNLDRPTDIAFGCFGVMRVTEGRTTGMVDDPVVLSPQPNLSCDIRSGDRVQGEPAPVPPGQEDLTDQGGVPLGATFWVGFILQPGPGTVALAQFQTKPSTSFAGSDVTVLDADPLTPGKNSISVGEDPIAIGTDATGCKVITANAGSCDLSVLDVFSAVDFNPGTPADVQRLAVKNAAGEPLRSKPAAMAMQPQTEVIGNRCPATPTGLAYIAYPSCHLVAAVDTSTGTVVSGIQFTDTGPTIVDGNVTCPDECTGGGTLTQGVRPVSLDLEQDPRTGERRLVIGSDNAPSVTVVELGDDPQQPATLNLPESIQQFALENTTGDLGVTHVALSPTMGMGGQIGVINDDTAAGGPFQFVYAITTDNTIRVVDVLTTLRECDTQIDPRYLRDIRSIRDLSCLPIGDPARPRRTGAKGPGIEINFASSIPLSVDFIKSVQIEGDSRPAEFPTKLIGYFAVVTAANGGAFVINVDDDDRRDLFDEQRPLLNPLPISMPHTMRDAIQNRELLARNEDLDLPICDAAGPDNSSGVITGGPRSTQNPQRNVPAGVFAAEKVTQLPTIRSVRCEGVDLQGNPSVRGVSEVSFAAPEDTRALVFPDISALTDEETWSFTWEGTLSQDRADTSIDGPVVRESELRVDASGMRLLDQSRPYCAAGVQPFDIVQMRGCNPVNGNADCPIDYRCFVHPDSQVPGLGACLLEDEADRLAQACRDFLISIRKYTVATSKAGTLELLPRRHILRTTPVEGCVSDEQCDVLADYAAKNPSPKHPVDNTIVDDRTWRCEADPSRAPVTTGKRCALKCDSNDDCFTGLICQGGTPGSGTKAGTCMEGVTPPQACVNAPQRYELRAGEAFAVVGEASGFQHATIEDETSGACVQDPAASPLLQSRIPLSPPACDPTADPLTGRLADGTFEPNPCSLTVEQTELRPLYNPGTCVLGNPASELVTRDAAAIRYRNPAMTITMIDPVYPGDQTCILDRAGVAGAESVNIPHVFTGYQFGFRQTAGFFPQFVNLPTLTFPVKVVRGPTNSIWVLDEGDFLSTSLAQPSTRGKVFRVEPSALNIINILE